MRELVAVAAVTAAVAGCKSRPPEADPATVQALAGTMIERVPVPGAARMCTPGELIGGATLTFRTLMAIAGRTPSKTDPTMAPWLHPPELDAPAATVLATPGADETERRRAAAELVAAPFVLAYRVDSIDAPMAFAVKELRRGKVEGRALRYDKTGAVVCIHLYQVLNSFEKTTSAIAASTKTLIDPAVAAALQDDLRARILVAVASLAAPPPPPKKHAFDVPDRPSE